MKTEKTQYPSRAIRQSKAHEALQRAKERERELERRGLLRRIEIGGTIVVGTAASTAELARRLGADPQQSEARPSQRELEGREPWLWCGCYWRSASSIAQELGILTQTATRHARALGLELHRITVCPRRLCLEASAAERLVQHLIEHVVKLED